MVLFACAKKYQNFNSTIEFTSNIETYQNIGAWKSDLEGVEIIGLGENTHGLGEIFKAKTELVKYLHEELGFDLILFESGFGDAAIAWEKINEVTTEEYVRDFTSNFYYQSEEIKELVEYVKSRNGKLTIQGIDCQPQQNYLKKSLEAMMWPLDSVLAKSVSAEMTNFNKMYQLEWDKDTIAFYNQKEKFIQFLRNYQVILQEKKAEVTNAECGSFNAIEGLLRTYKNLQFGELMEWPTSYNFRDRAMFENVMWYKNKFPNSKIIIWAQNSHIENRAKLNDNVDWLGHLLHDKFGTKYYSIGSEVYSGKNMEYNSTFDFEHIDSSFLAFHLNELRKPKLLIHLREYSSENFLNEELKSMESNGNIGTFIPNERFDAILFIKSSQPPNLLN